MNDFRIYSGVRLSSFYAESGRDIRAGDRVFRTYNNALAYLVFCCPGPPDKRPAILMGRTVESNLRVGGRTREGSITMTRPNLVRRQVPLEEWRILTETDVAVARAELDMLGRGDEATEPQRQWVKSANFVMPFTTTGRTSSGPNQQWIRRDSYQRQSLAAERVMTGVHPAYAELDVNYGEFECRVFGFAQEAYDLVTKNGGG